MKKQYLISLFITCAVIFSVNAQNTPIDDFLRQYPSREGVTHVSLSKDVLHSIFDSFSPSVPEAYSSLSISRTNIPANVFADFKRSILALNFRILMYSFNENSEIFRFHRTTNNGGEIIFLRQEKDLFSAVFIRGNFDDTMQGELYLRILNKSISDNMLADQIGTNAAQGVFNFSDAGYRTVGFFYPPSGTYTTPNTLEFMEQRIESFKERSRNR